MINPRSKEENEVIQYGFELVLDNLLKLLFIEFIGILMGKGLETFIILISFCTLRSQAGGIHAKTNAGCAFGMVIVWGLSLLGSSFIRIGDLTLIMFSLVAVVAIIIFSPKSKNIEFFTNSTVVKKKTFSTVIALILMIMAFVFVDFRELIVWSVSLEVLTLLPKNKEKVKGD